MRKAKTRTATRGFTLLETMIAMVVTVIGALGLAAMLGDAMGYMLTSQDDFIAQQKAEEAMEAIFTAKYDNNITFAEIANSTSTPPGIFLSGPQPLLHPGPDGLVGTTADINAAAEYILQPGPDGLLGTADDIQVPLGNFTRTITIAATSDSNLAQITVTINYTAGRFNRSYTMQSYISAFN
jgi:prepilin-type N-terminal cleavage/methylation domain-containing protein